MLSTSAGSAAVEGSGCMEPHCMKPPHPQTVSNLRLITSEQLPHIPRTLPVNVGHSESTFHMQSEMRCEFQLPTFCSQRQGSELMEQTHTFQEFSQANDTESDLPVEIETFNINFPKEIPLSTGRSVANKHRTSVHIQSEFDLTQFFPEIVSCQPTKPCQLPVEKTLPMNVSEVVSLPLETSVETVGLLTKPRMTSPAAAQTNGRLMLITDLLSNEHEGLVSSQVASGDKSVNYIINPEEITVECKNLQTAASNYTEIAVSEDGSQLGNIVEQVISEATVQESLLETTENFKFHSELKNEIQAAPIPETHVNVFTVLPHEETMIELLPRKITGKLNIENEIRARLEQSTYNKKFESSTNVGNFHDTIQQNDLFGSIPESKSPDELGETNVLSPTLSLFVKQRNSTKHSSKPEENSDPLCDYKWHDNWQMTNGKWCNMWPIDSTHISHNPEKSECPLFSTDCSTNDVFKSLCAQNDNTAVQVLVHESDFDEDIEVNVFVDDNLRHSLHEIEETIDQLVSDVEMDETQLLKHLSFLESPIVKSSGAVENDDVICDSLGSENTISSTAVTQNEGPKKQGHFENNRPVRAEVKLLVKTCDTGKEAIEIRSMKEYLDVEVVHGQEDSPSMYTTDLIASTCVSENFQEQPDFPQDLEPSAKHIPVKLMQSSSEFINDDSILHSHELSQNGSLKLKIFENIQLGSDLSKNMEPVSSMHDLKEGYTSVTSECRQEHNMGKYFHLSHDGKLLDDSTIQKPKMPKQREQEDRQLQQIQRLFIRTPNLALSEPLNMLPSGGSTKQQSSATNIKPHEIKKLLIRSPNYENFITFPIVTPPSSIPSDLRPLSITPTPPPQHLPKTKLFENLPRVPLASDEDLKSVSPLRQNISLENIFFSFLPIDDISDIPDGSNSCTHLSRSLSMPCLAVGIGSPSSTTIPLSEATLSHPLTRVVSMPLLQHAVYPIATELNETYVSSSHSSYAEPKDWTSVCGDEDEISLIMQSSSDTNQTSSPSTIPVSTFSRQDILAMFGQPKSSLPKSPGSSRSYHMKKCVSSPSSSSSLHTEIVVPHISPNFSRYCGRKSPDFFNSMSLNNCPDLTKTPPRSSGSPKQCRFSQNLNMSTLTCSQTTLSNTLGKSDPWYLQTEFLLSPVAIPSGYCTWVPTPDQQTYSRGKEGVNFEILTL